jgi:hypothetical protein
MELRVCEDCNKGINNPNGVVSGETLYNWWSEVVKYRNIVQYLNQSISLYARSINFLFLWKYGNNYCEDITNTMLYVIGLDYIAIKITPFIL